MQASDPFVRRFASLNISQGISRLHCDLPPQIAQGLYVDDWLLVGGWLHLERVLLLQMQYHSGLHSSLLQRLIGG